MADFSFRAAHAADALAVAEVFISSRHAHQPFAPLAHDEEDVRRWVRDVMLPQGGVTVACAPDGEVVGFIAMGLENSMAWIWQLHFAPGHTTKVAAAPCCYKPLRHCRVQCGSTLSNPTAARGAFMNGMDFKLWSSVTAVATKSAAQTSCTNCVR